MLKTIQLLVLLISYVTGGYAQNTNLNLDEKKLALEGYDPVSYFKEKKAVKGKSSIAIDNEGVRHQFSTQANKALFASDPSAYKPQYGGWCAYAMGAKGEKVEVDPETFKVVDGKLYLFYNRLFNNTLEEWNKNEAELKANADKNWTKLVKP